MHCFVDSITSIFALEINNGTQRIKRVFYQRPYSILENQGKHCYKIIRKLEIITKSKSNK